MRKLSTWLASAGLLLGAGLLTGPASAGPVGNLGGLQQHTGSNMEPVHYRRYHRHYSRHGCWWAHGHWHCPRYRRYVRYHYPYHGGYRRHYYGYGGPTIAFSFGGGRHFYGGHRWGDHRHYHRGWGGRW
jgi:hypothetical protein